MIKDMTLEWNAGLLQAIRVNGGPPTPISRTAAMMHLAMYDAVNVISPKHAAYLPGAAIASSKACAGNRFGTKEAAAIGAAHTVLLDAYPRQSAYLDALKTDTRNSLVAGGQPAADVDAGISFGRCVGLEMIKHRANDNSGVIKFFEGTKPGQWRETGSGPAATPAWGGVKPFVIPNAAAFHPPKLTDLAGEGSTTLQGVLKTTEYARQLADVQALGSAYSTVRTAEQTEIAIFWANDLDRTSKPPGQLYDITRIVLQQYRKRFPTDARWSFEEGVRLFALVAAAMADAAIVAWDVKYIKDFELWRPESAIRLAGFDGNLLTTHDFTWTPLSADVNGNRFSPPFPAYVSGHATFGAAHAGIMRRFFGTDFVTFTLSTEDPHMPRDEYGIKKTRTFQSFTEAALENGRSRIYLGVHFQWDAAGGYESGTKIANHVIENALT